MSDGFRIHTIFAQPLAEPVAHVHLLHGMAEHIGRYKEFINYLVGQGYAVSGHDHRGHGQTASLNGKLGHFGDSVGFERTVEDAYEVVNYYKDKFAAPTFILLGHSMGSFIARRYVQRYGGEVDRLICSGTAGDPRFGRIAGKALAQLKGRATHFDLPDHFINKLVFGSFSKSVKSAKTPFDWLSADNSTVETYINDPLCGLVPTTGFFIDLFEGLKKIHNTEEIGNIPKTLPILLLSGLDDPVGDKGKGVWKVAQQYAHNGIENVTVMLYDEGRHEMLQELNRDRVFNFIKDWIEK